MHFVRGWRRARSRSVTRGHRRRRNGNRVSGPVTHTSSSPCTRLGWTNAPMPSRRCARVSIATGCRWYRSSEESGWPTARSTSATRTASASRQYKGWAIPPSAKARRARFTTGTGCPSVRSSTATSTPTAIPLRGQQPRSTETAPTRSGASCTRTSRRFGHGSASRPRRWMWTSSSFGPSSSAGGLTAHRSRSRLTSPIRTWASIRPA